MYVLHQNFIFVPERKIQLNIFSVPIPVQINDRFEIFFACIKFIFVHFKFVTHLSSIYQYFGLLLTSSNFRARYSFYNFFPKKSTWNENTIFWCFTNPKPGTSCKVPREIVLNTENSVSGIWQARLLRIF